MALTASMETGAATAVVGLAAYQLWDAWNKNAPSLADLRAAGAGSPDALGTAQQLLDAELTVGSLAGIIGLTFLVLTGHWTVLLIMVLIFATLSLWHHAVLNSDPR